MSDSAAQPEFWNTRYAAGRTPWDFGGVPAALGEFLVRHPGAGRRVLVPGCGSGYEVAALHAAGWEPTAIDFSPSAVARAHATLGPAHAARVVLGDFFAHDFAKAPFDFIYERTFLCALPPRLRADYARRIAALLAPGGQLAGFFFFTETPPDDGPPFGLAPGEPEQLFAADLALEVDAPASDSLPIFAGKERWQERRRR